MSYGVRKVNEYIIRDGRALVLTQDVKGSLTSEQWDSVADGTLYVSPTNKTLKYKNGENWTNFDPTKIFNQKSINGALINDNAITTNKIANNAITKDKIIDNAITTDKIAEETISDKHIYKEKDEQGNIIKGLNGTLISPNSIRGNRLINNTITTEKIRDNSITEEKICDSSITNEKLDTDSVSSINIQNKSIITDKIADRNITSNKIAKEAIKTEHIYITKDSNGKITDGLDGTILKPLSITNDKIYSKAVTESKIGTNAVTTSKIKDLSITTNKIYNLAITEDKIGTDAITTNKIKDLSITKEKLTEEISNIIDKALILDNEQAIINGDIIAEPYFEPDNDQVYPVRCIKGFKVFNPVFADYAEGFEAIEEVEVGDIVELKNNHKIGKAEYKSSKIVGVVSNRYGICLDASDEELNTNKKVAVALIGKVPIKIIGEVEVGDFIISNGYGIGIATKDFIGGKIIGKAMENNNSKEIKNVLCLIQPM